MTQQCKAKSKRTGEQCKRSVTPGRDVCHYHGGKSLKGLAHPNTKTGRWSKDLPTRLAARYLEAKDDPELLELKSDIALVDARLSEVLSNLSSGDTRKLWQDLKATFELFEKATVEGDKPTQAETFRKLKYLIQQGNSAYTNWVEVYGLIDQRRRTVESERKRYVEMQQTITADRAMLLVGALVGIIRQHVTDNRTLQAISTDIRNLTVIDAGG